MQRASSLHLSDLVGLSRLAIGSTSGLTDVVEAMHSNVPGILPETTSGITKLVYDSVRAVTGVVGGGIDSLLTPTIPELEEKRSSLGALVTRSAHHDGVAAGHRWPSRLNKLIFLGTPHHGAPLERGGNWVDVILQLSPYTSPLFRLAKIRSAHHRSALRQPAG